MQGKLDIFLENNTFGSIVTPGVYFQSTLVDFNSTALTGVKEIYFILNNLSRLQYYTSNRCKAIEFIYN